MKAHLGRMRSVLLNKNFLLKEPPTYEESTVFANSMYTACASNGKALVALQVERVLVRFVESAENRYSFPAMPSEQRRVVHEMSSNFGLISHSFAPEPHRHIELFQGIACSY